jgi:amidase
MAAIPDDALGAFCRHTHVAISGSGTGPLAGLTFGVKDIYDIAGHKTGFGSPDWLATHDAAVRTAPVVEALLAAGADMVGKTQTDELTYSLNGENAHYGTPVNINAPGRIPGGSSSGSAAAVAGKLVDFALGSDTGGSVRAPASFCGVYGIRPTHGRVSLQGACALAKSFDTAGWFARDALLLERIGRVLLGEAATVDQGAALLAEDAFALLGSAAARARKNKNRARTTAAHYGQRRRPAAMVPGFPRAAGRGDPSAARRLGGARAAETRPRRARAHAVGGDDRSGGCGQCAGPARCRAPAHG